MLYPQYNFKELEPAILKYWQQQRIVEKRRRKNKQGEKFYFLQGPPYTSGNIHLGHAWNMALKDMVLRYKRMRGMNVWDRMGYDMHGLPTEQKVMAKLALHDKQEIQKFGLKKFQRECRKFCTEMMGRMTEDFLRLGATLDFSKPYQPIKKEFMEAEWWLIKQAHAKGRLYQGLRTMHWDVATQSAVAKHELEYRTVTDSSIYMKFPHQSRPNTFFIIWTTTPWTIPLNLAIMANPELEYVEADMQNGKVSEERRLEDIKKGYILSLQARRIHEIERDDSFLQQIPEVQVVMVGKGHSDYWVQYQKIDGEKYSTDTAQQYGLSEARAIFTENATPNPRTAYERVSLERTIHFMETGRISDQAADYVGTWDLYNPWQGYFELFIKQKSKHRFSGIIEDCIGTATFEGWLRPNGIDFVKRYQESTEDALQEPLCYYAEGRKSEIAGSYSIGIGKMPFCMVKKSQEDPRELVLRWEKLNRMRKAEFRGV